MVFDDVQHIRRMRLGMFDPANDSSYHTLSPADVNTADSQVYWICEITKMHILLFTPLRIWH